MAAHDANSKSKSLNKPSGGLDLFDQLQDEFDALLSGEELPKQEDVRADKKNTLTDLVLQDTNEFLSTTDMRAFDMPSGQPADARETMENTDVSDTDVSEPQLEQTDIEMPANETSASVSDDMPALETGPEAEPKPDQDIVEPAMAATASEATPSWDNVITDEIASTELIEDSMAHDQEENSLSHLDKKLESISQESSGASANSALTRKIFLQETDLSDAAHAEKEETWQPMLDQHPPDLDGVNPFADDMDDRVQEDKAPVHPDMSEDNTMQRRGGGRFMMLAGILVVIVAGGIYWLAGGPQESVKQLASDQGQGISKTGDSAQGLSDTPSVNPAEAQQAPGKTPTEEKTLEQPASEKAVAAQQAETKKTAIQRAAVEKAKDKQLAAKQAAEKRAAAKKAKAEQLAAKQAAEKRVAAEKAAARKMAVTQPSTQIQEQPLESQASATVVNEPGEWIIELASVNSDKSARQHLARLRAMGVEGKTVQVNDKGRIFHSIRIAGFTSKQAAMKRRDVLMKLLGVRGAKVEKL